MKITIHHPRQYSPEEVEAFRRRMEEHRLQAEEYDEPGAGMAMLAYLVGFILVAAVIGWFVLGWWVASDKLVGI